MQCVYCPADIDESNSSSEHIIPNALGGLLESNKICCKECNTKFGETADSDFTKTFAAITENINIKKSRVTAPSKYKAIVEDMMGKKYNAEMKGKKIWTVLSNEGKYMNNSIDIKTLEPIEYKFEVKNDVFKIGFTKIAFNYAVHCGIEPRYLDAVYDFENSKLKNKLMVIPFIPLNFFDKCIEYEKINDLKHAIILFSHNNILAAYIELFSTFQFYVVLSNDWKGDEIYESYCQLVEKKEFDINKEKENIKISSYKDMMIIADQYQLDYSSNFEEIEFKALEAIRKKEYEIDYLKYIYEQTYKCNCANQLIKNKNMEDYFGYMNYFIPESEDEAESIDPNKFRIINYTKNETHLYIKAIHDEISSNGFTTVVIPYTNQKMMFLSKKILEVRSLQES